MRSPPLVVLGLMVGAIGAIAAQDGGRPDMVAGARNDTGQMLPGELEVRLREDAGYPVERRFNAAGTGFPQPMMEPYPAVDGRCGPGSRRIPPAAGNDRAIVLLASCCRG